MPDHSSAPWEQLFSPSRIATEAITMRLHLVRKRGEPLLLLPSESRLARTALALYPAQTGRAKAARQLLRCGLGLMSGWVTAPVTILTDAQAPFVGFLRQAAGTRTLPRFAMLLGNPRAPGRRFVLLLFNERDEPVAVVKAGWGPAARSLIDAEQSFLESQAAELLRAPRLLGKCSAGDCRAFAQEFVAGATPSAAETACVADLLNAWLQRDREVHFAELSVAKRLAAAAGAEERWRPVLTSLASMRFHPAIHHGDFAPWNVRVDARRQWKVLDWERGEATGPPAWDWFHWRIQNEVLVLRTPTPELARRVDALLNSPEFRSYAANAGIDRKLTELLVAYLLYCSRVIRQADGLPAVEALLEHLAARIRPEH